MSEKLHIGIDKTILDTMNSTSNYYFTTNKNAEVMVEEETIPLAVIQTRISSTQTELTTVSNRLGTAEGEIDTLQLTDTSLDARLDTAESSIGTAQTDIIALDGRLDLAEPKITTLQSDTISLDERLDTAETNISSLNTRMNTAEFEISGAQSSISVLNSKVSSLENPDYITVVKTANLTIGTTETIIDFNSTISSNNITNSSGEITVTKAGVYSGIFTCWINQGSNPTLWMFIEKLPSGSSTWEIYRNNGNKIISRADTQYIFQLDGNVILDVGDKIRLKMIRIGGSTTMLESSTTVIGSTTITQYPAMLSIFKI